MRSWSAPGARVALSYNEWRLQMATVYKFTVSLPVTDTLARNRISNTVHLEHVVGSQSDEQLEGICADMAAMYQARYGVATKEVNVKAYDVDAKPNYPRASVTVNPGQVWTSNLPREVALCLSFAGDNRGNKAERGRIYLAHWLAVPLLNTGLRPDAAAMAWALKFYTEPNGSFPDLGGVDWKFGVYSRTYSKFTQSQQAWVNDDWDTQRRRGLRETTRQSATREG